MPQYRPWGLLDWVLARCPGLHWDLLGCLGTGERSLGAWQCLRCAGVLRHTRFIRVANLPSRFDSQIASREQERLTAFRDAGGNPADIEPHLLMEPHNLIVQPVNDLLRDSGGSVILDVSTMPKRFFYPLLKRLLKAQLSNLLVAYTVPQSYTSEKLAENINDWDHLPLFSGAYSRDPARMFIIGVGFEAFGLQDQIDHGSSGLPIKLLVPFPSAPQAFRRSWELVRKLQEHRSSDTFQIYRVDAREAGDAFDRLLTLTERGDKPVLLAPFGPKSISVAMCIFATLTESPVYYTQPTVYHPDYSSGIAQVNGRPAVYGYCIRLNGRDLFALSS